MLILFTKLYIYNFIYIYYLLDKYKYFHIIAFENNCIFLLIFYRNLNFLFISQNMSNFKFLENYDYCNLKYFPSLKVKWHATHDISSDSIGMLQISSRYLSAYIACYNMTLGWVPENWLEIFVFLLKQRIILMTIYCIIARNHNAGNVS